MLTLHHGLYHRSQLRDELLPAIFRVRDFARRATDAVGVCRQGASRTC